mgnify:CR=1 FL=1
MLIVTAFVTTRIMGVDLTNGIAAGDLALAGAWFVLGYALYCGAYAAAGSLVSGLAGLADRVDRHLVDIVAEPEAVESADVVVLHRVVCCYPDYRGLLGAAADHARRTLVFSHPRGHVLNRATTFAENSCPRISGLQAPVSGCG